MKIKAILAVAGLVCVICGLGKIHVDMIVSAVDVFLGFVMMSPLIKALDEIPYEEER